MGLKDRVRGLFQGREVQSNTRKQTSEQAAESQTNAGSLSNLIVALDSVSEALAKSGLNEDHTAQYATTLNDMKKEISGVLDAHAIPELYAALEEVFSKTLLKVFQYGKTEQVNEVKAIVFSGIKALPGTQKEQQLATLDLDIASINGEIWEANYWLIIRQSELREKQQAMINDPENLDLLKSVQMLAVQIKNLRRRNETAQTELEGLLTRKRDIEADALGISFRETHERIASFIDSLPSAIEQAKAIEAIEEIGDRNKAKMTSEINLLAKVLGGIEEEISNTFPAKSSVDVAKVTGTSAQSSTDQSGFPVEEPNV